MKLKKIVSLALAGILAVSMLTACGDNSNSNSGNGETDVTPTSTTASVLRENLSGNSRRNVEAVANSSLDAALKDAVADYCNNYTVKKFVGQYGLQDVREWELGKDVISTMKAEDTITKLGDGKTKTTTAVEVYAIDKSISDNYVLEMLADKINAYCDATQLPDKSKDGEYDYDYDISATIVTVDGNNSVVDQGVKFVAFAVTQNVEKFA
ncbi:hypothetical protein [Faecalibacterium sp. An192]|uniref:hypothetical protein n=1 Tax=Faecalibacterium sp. An192 TaxID=1965581 RepID=UPI000B389EDA|nr:hypothetical protein [Faecalibacterium sp. An192]OUP27648.1 hypothetical protein B5F27_09215 [Faecalibacterium sp. An192]